MSFSAWRGVVGLIRPTLRPGGLEEIIRMLPEGIGVIPLFNNIQRGDESEFREVIRGYEDKLELLADQRVDIMHPSGAPPFMMLGYEDEQRLIRQWERRYRAPVFTSGMNQIAALKALGVKRIVGVSYFPEKLNRVFGQYFHDAGFDVLAMEGVDVPFDKVQELSSQSVYSFIKPLWKKHRKEAQVVYMLGSGWRTLDIVETMEKDFEIPVLQSICAQVWEFQTRLDVRHPLPGFGKLMREMPDFPR